MRTKLAFRSACSAVFLASCCGGAAVSGERSLATENFVVGYSDIDDAQARKFAVGAENALAAVTSYLNRPYGKVIRVNIGDEHLYPHFDRRSRTVVIPANRIRGDADGPPFLRGRGPGIVDVIANVIAPSANKRWARFLEVGFRIFLQEKFGATDDRSYPSMGRDLHRETARMVADYGRFISLEEVEDVRTRRKRLGRARRLAHLQEGSFVRFLIETRGLPMFLAVYDGSSFEKVYGARIAALEKEWQGRIERLEP